MQSLHVYDLCIYSSIYVLIFNTFLFLCRVKGGDKAYPIMHCVRLASQGKHTDRQHFYTCDDTVMSHFHLDKWDFVSPLSHVLLGIEWNLLTFESIVQLYINVWTSDGIRLWLALGVTVRISVIRENVQLEFNWCWDKWSYIHSFKACYSCLICPPETLGKFSSMDNVHTGSLFSPFLWNTEKK